MILQADHERLNKLIGSMRSCRRLLLDLAALPRDEFLDQRVRILTPG